MRAGQVHAAIVLMSVLLFACASPPNSLFPPGPNEPSRTIYLVSHGWHAGIVVKRTDIPAGFWPQHNEFPGAEYLEVGWGDKDYYMTPNPNLGITLKAGLLPTASVLHVVGFRGPVTHYFPAQRSDSYRSLRGRFPTPMPLSREQLCPRRNRSQSATGPVPVR